MSTHSTIGIQNSDGSIDAIYCHYDGYFSNNGFLLKNHFNTLEKVQELISLGDLSYLEKNIHPTEKHDFDYPQDGVCVFYGRDRGEQNVASQNYSDLKSFISHAQEYAYVFKDDKWYYVNLDGYNLLTDEIIKNGT